VLKVKTGQPVLVCNRCEQPVHESGAGPGQPQVSSTTRSCRYCDRVFPVDYVFCPICGRRL
jgi:hypothetical protein